MSGPDILLPAESLTTTAPNGCVKIRDYDPEDLKGMSKWNFNMRIIR